MFVEKYMIIYALFAELDNEYKLNMRTSEKSFFPFIVTHSRKKRLKCW